MTNSQPPLDELRQRFALEVPHLVKARDEAAAKNRELRGALAEFLENPDPDLGLTVSGSLARLEWTSGSDIDWSLLVDGAVRSSHLHTAKKIERVMVSFGKKPNPNGAFGNLVISHNLVHLIGGNTDTNANTTQRILLLLESASLGDDQVRSRVTRAILERYLEQDTHFNPEKTPRVPRFLINDIVRYWRTMAVDYASKHQAEAAHKFAIRNIKLRMSRKLIFISGLLMVFACDFELPVIPPNQPRLFDLGDDEEFSIIPYIQHLAGYVNQTPLDILAQACMRYEANADTVCGLFESYDSFLAALDDPNARQHLEKIDYATSKNDPQFKDLRETSHRFQESLKTFFFETNDSLRDLMQEYAVF
jgi:hypothetical protein